MVAPLIRHDPCVHDLAGEGVLVVYVGFVPGGVRTNTPLGIPSSLCVGCKSSLCRRFLRLGCDRDANLLRYDLVRLRVLYPDVRVGGLGILFAGNALGGALVHVDLIAFFLTVPGHVSYISCYYLDPSEPQ